MFPIQHLVQTPFLLNIPAVPYLQGGYDPKSTYSIETMQ